MIPTFSNCSLHNRSLPNYTQYAHCLKPFALWSDLCTREYVTENSWSLSPLRTRTHVPEKNQHLNQSFNDNLSRAKWSLFCTHTSAKKKKTLSTVSRLKPTKANRRASRSRRQNKHQSGSGVTRVGGQGTENTLWEVRGDKQAIKALLLTAKC